MSKFDNETQEHTMLTKWDNEDNYASENQIKKRKKYT